MTITYDDFINSYDRNMNMNNVQHLSDDLTQRLEVLKSMSAADRMMKIKEMEIDIASFDNNTVYVDSIKPKSKKLAESDEILTRLHAEIEEREKEMKLLYKRMNVNFIREKLTSCEYESKKQSNQVNAKIFQMKICDLLNVTLYQLKVYKKYEAEIKEEKIIISKIKNIMEEMKKYLNDAKVLQEKKSKIFKKNEIYPIDCRDTLQRCMEEREIEEKIIPVSFSTEMKNIKSMKNKLQTKNEIKTDLIDKNKIIKKKPKFINKPNSRLNKNKKLDKLGTRKNNKKIFFNNKRTKNKGKPKVKHDVKEINIDTTLTEQPSEDNGHFEESIKEPKNKNKPVNVGCCGGSKTRNISTKSDQSVKEYSMKESIKSDIEHKSIKVDNIMSDNKVRSNSRSIKEENKDKKGNENNLKKSNDFKKPRSRSKTPKYNSTNSLKSKSQSSRSTTPTSSYKIPVKNSKTTPKKPISKSPKPKSTKTAQKTIEPKQDSNVKKKSVTLESLSEKKENLHEDVSTQSKSIKLEEPLHNEVLEDFGIKSENKHKAEIQNDPDKSEKNLIGNKKIFFTEDEIIQKIKKNDLRYELSFSADYYKKVDNTQNEKDCNKQKDEVKTDEDKQNLLEKMKSVRIERLKLEEKDRHIVKHREFEKERLDEEKRNENRIKDFLDHQSYIKTIKRKGKEEVPELEMKEKTAKVIKQPKVIYDYQNLLFQSKNVEVNTKNPNLYKTRNLDTIELENKNPAVLQKEEWIKDNDENINESIPTHRSIIDVDQNENVNDSDNIIPIEENDGMEEMSIPETYGDESKIEMKEEIDIKSEVIADVDNEKIVPSENKEENIEKTEKSENSKEKNLENVLLNKTSDVDLIENSKSKSKKLAEFQESKSVGVKSDTGCFGLKKRKKQNSVKESEKSEEKVIAISTEVKSSEVSSVEELNIDEVTKDAAEEVFGDIIPEYVKVESESDDDKSVDIPENEINNPKYWKQNIYYVELKSLFERKIACIIRAKPGSLPKRKMLTCQLILSSEEVPQLDQREDYTSYIFKIFPRNYENASQISNDTIWHLAIPYYLPETSSKQPLIMQMSDDESQWIDCSTHDAIFDNLKQSGLKFVETKIQKPYGTFAVVSYLMKDRTIVNKEGTQLTSTTDRNVIFSVPPDAIRISINTSLQVTCLDRAFWKEIKEKHEKTSLDSIYLSSSVVEIEAKKKKLTSPAILTLSMAADTPKAETNALKRKATTDTEEIKYEDDKTIKKILNPFQKTLLMPSVNSAQIMQDVHFLSYINEEERWNIIGNPNLNYDKSKEQINVELPALQSSKYILLKSKRKTSDEAITKAAKIIDNELCVRNCVIALFQSIKVSCDFALIVSLKKYFQGHINHLQDEGYIIDAANKLTYVELKERQILKIEFVGNIKNVIPENNVTEFAFHSLFPNTQKFRVKEIDAFAQKAISSFRGYVDISTKSLVKRPVQSADGKIRKVQTQYTWVEENIMISHLLISIKKRRIPKVSPFFNFKFHFKNFHRCVDIIKKVASRIGPEWWELGTFLNVTETRMHSIKLHNQEKGVHKMAEQMLLYWLKGCETNENKYELLTMALKGCGRFDIAERLQKPQNRLLVFGC